MEIDLGVTRGIKINNWRREIPERIKELLSNDPIFLSNQEWSSPKDTDVMPAGDTLEPISGSESETEGDGHNSPPITGDSSTTTTGSSPGDHDDIALSTPFERRELLWTPDTSGLPSKAALSTNPGTTVYPNVKSKTKKQHGDKRGQVELPSSGQTEGVVNTGTEGSGKQRSGGKDREAKEKGGKKSPLVPTAKTFKTWGTQVHASMALSDVSTWNELHKLNQKLDIMICNQTLILSRLDRQEVELQAISTTISRGAHTATVLPISVKAPPGPMPLSGQTEGVMNTGAEGLPTKATLPTNPRTTVYPNVKSKTNKQHGGKRGQVELLSSGRTEGVVNNGAEGGGKQLSGGKGGQKTPLYPAVKTFESRVTQTPSIAFPSIPYDQDRDF